MMKKRPRGLRTWIEVDTKALEHNYKTFRGLIPKNCRLMAVVKSNAYGHGLVGFSRIVSKLGINFLGVDSIVEAITLRKNGIKKPILVLGSTLPERISEAAKYDISLTVSYFDNLENLIHYKGTNSLKIHLKIDTGMHRQGFFPNEVPAVIPILGKLPREIQLEGVYTHFPSVKDPAEKGETKTQLAAFKQALDILRNPGFSPIAHASATAATLIYPEAHLDMVRIGIGLYGLWPAPETQDALRERIQLLPTLSWKTIISEIKKLPKNAKIGYGGSEITDKPTVVAICPVGYWHGFPRSLSSKAFVLVGGKRCKVLGRVSMDMIVINISGVKNPRAADIVTLIGKDGEEEITADELARIADTISYEIITRLNPLIQRFYV